MPEDSGCSKFRWGIPINKTSFHLLHLLYDSPWYPSTPRFLQFFYRCCILKPLNPRFLPSRNNSSFARKATCSEGLTKLTFNLLLPPLPSPNWSLFSFKTFSIRRTCPDPKMTMIIHANRGPPHASSPQWLLSNSSLTPQRPYIMNLIEMVLDFPAIFSKGQGKCSRHFLLTKKRLYQISHSTKEEGLKNNRATNIWHGLHGWVIFGHNKVYPLIKIVPENNRDRSNSAFLTHRKHGREKISMLFLFETQGDHIPAKSDALWRHPTWPTGRDNIPRWLTGCHPRWRTWNDVIQDGPLVMMSRGAKNLNSCNCSPLFYTAKVGANVEITCHVFFSNVVRSSGDAAFWCQHASIDY